MEGREPSLFHSEYGVNSEELFSCCPLSGNRSARRWGGMKNKISFSGIALAFPFKTLIGSTNGTASSTILRKGKRRKRFLQNSSFKES